MKNHMISTAYGDFNGFPPTILVTGTRVIYSLVMWCAPIEN